MTERDYYAELTEIKAQIAALETKAEIAALRIQAQEATAAANDLEEDD